MPDSIFETVLASTVHEMKNSLGLLMNQLDDVDFGTSGENRKTLSSIKYEASRINTSLMEMLALYKLENKQLSLHIDEVVVIDLIEDCVAAFAVLADSKDVRIEVDCDEMLIWFFDPDLVGIAINNIVGNSIRYAESLIRISVAVQANELGIQIDDDGDGYPQKMLLDVENFTNRVNLSSGSTGLGLFFAHRIASIHERKNRSGYIQLANGGKLSGGSFRISLP